MDFIRKILKKKKKRVRHALYEIDNNSPKYCTEALPRTVILKKKVIYHVLQIQFHVHQE